ncbi:MAG: DUF3710 domain-containing protein [Actinomycetota bacterium]|nr:MAG: DUF3710 domain-containing protein [Actinomycetota bacterium]
MFRRRRHQDGAEPIDPDHVDPDQLDDDHVDGEPDAVTQAAGTGPTAPRPADRSAGPYDEDEAAPQRERLDLGALRLPAVPGAEIRVEVDQQTGAVTAVTVVLADSAVQLQPFAAPRTAGIWDEARREIRGQVSSSGGTVDEVTGPFGPEVRTQVPAQLPDGSPAVQPARFVGVDGPRWFLRAVFLGQAALDPAAAAELEQLVRDVVVVRGGEAMPPGEPLPLRLPTDAVADGSADGDGPAGAGDLNPYERGPEITEIR